MKDPTGTRSTVSSLAAVASIIAASSCCLPVLPFVVAAGLAGSSAWLNAMRPYLLIASVVLIGYGFYQARKARQCRTGRSAIHSFLLWFAALIVFVSILFPQVMANLAADLSAR